MSDERRGPTGQDGATYPTAQQLGWLYAERSKEILRAVDLTQLKAVAVHRSNYSVDYIVEKLTPKQMEEVLNSDWALILEIEEELKSKEVLFYAYQRILKKELYRVRQVLNAQTPKPGAGQ